MDEIINIEENLEEAKRHNINRYYFPAVTITSWRNQKVGVATFNAKCNPIYKKYVELKMSDNYVYFRFTDKKSKEYYTAIKTCQTEKGFSGFRFVSTHLNRYSLVGKTFKLKKYKDGYLIEVRKPLERR